MSRKSNAVLQKVIAAIDAKIEALTYARQQLLAQQTAVPERRPAAAKPTPAAKAS